MDQDLRPGAWLSLDHMIQLPRAEAEALIRERVRAVPLAANRVQLNVLGRYRFFVDARDVHFGSHLIGDGYWEIWLTEFMARLIQPGWTALDVGANYGYFTVLMADRVGPEGRVVAYEPNPVAARSLLDAVRVNGFASRATVRAVAASDREGTSWLYVPDEEPGGAQIVWEGYEDQRPGRLIQVPECRIADDLEPGRRVDVVKLDAEGAEERILAGMSAVIERDRPHIVLEFNAATREPWPLLETLTRHYGQIHFIDHDGTAKPVSMRRLIEERVGEVWMLYVARR